MSPSDIPNLISVLRIVLVGPIIVSLLTHRYTLALVMIAAAGVSDGLDGFLAKRYGWTSRLGTLLDPLADKILLVSCFVVLGVQGLLPAWLVALVILRDVIIVTGALVYNFRIERVEASPTVISKLNTAAQILLVVVTVLHHGPLPLPGAIIVTLVVTVTVTTIWSGSGYVWNWSRRALHAAAPSRR